MTAVPLVILKSNKRLIPEEIRRYMVTLLLQRDGLNSDFIPADLASFMEDGPEPSMKAFGIKMNSKAAHLPEDFEENNPLDGVHLEPSYIPTSTKIDYTKIT